MKIFIIVGLGFFISNLNYKNMSGRYKTKFIKIFYFENFLNLYKLF